MSTAAVRQPVDATAASIMLLLCLVWGFTNVFSKLAAQDMLLELGLH